MTLPIYSYPLAISSGVPIVTSADELAAELPYTELLLDEATGDIAYPPQWVTGVGAVLQRIRFRLRMFKGEWFLDKRQGMPYYQAILGVKNPDLGFISSLFRRAIESTPGVQTVVRMGVSLEARRLTINPLEILLTAGVVFRAQPDEFIVPLTSEPENA